MDIDAIWTAHAATYTFFSHHESAMLCPMIGPGPIATRTAQIDAAWRDIGAKMDRVRIYAEKSVPYSEDFLASLLHRFHNTPGESQEEKAIAFCGVLADSPAGNIVEIGCLLGKSAVVLKTLQSFWNPSVSMICIDPFNIEKAVQHDSSAEIQALTKSWDGETLYRGFMLNMGCIHGWALIRETSDDAFPLYEVGLWKKIALLHIDGNHDYEQVMRDWMKWGKYVVSGGWIVFDDYEWVHGNGPKRAADFASLHYGAKVRRQFVAGGALFIQLKNDSVNNP
jgi:hypothetical protein